MSAPMTTLAQVHAMLPDSQLIHADQESAREILISRIGSDSRQIQSGDIFFAYPVGHGNALRDGRQFIEAALESGAAAVIFDPTDSGAQYLDHPKCIAIENLAEKVGELSAQWYDYPSKQLKVIGVTGTNGKTSVTQ